MPYFRVLPNGTRPPPDTKSRAYLIEDNWDDWFTFNTLYLLVLFDETGTRHDIGGVKIGQFGMLDDQRRADIPSRFDTLDEQFFSLGQDDSYYDVLNALGADVRNQVLNGLRDTATDAELFARALGEKVTGTSLLRSVSPTTVRTQFRRMALGGARLSSYRFSYTAPATGGRLRGTPLSTVFEVEPESSPPTNVHVFIGRNGVGKTTILNNMARAIADPTAGETDVGSFNLPPGDLFSNLVSVTFSAFDPFEPIPSRQDRSEGVHYAYVGLKYTTRDKDGRVRPPKSPDALSADFGFSVSVCSQGARAQRWQRALTVLESDPIFRDAAIASLASGELEGDDLKTEARDVFRRLSSGHKIVLLTITRLVETVEERTLVLLDEPEAHLHPPLLSAFIRALSDLLINRNGVAIVATHSPVILQEVPRTCVWKIRRTGRRATATRPDIETFGENVGVLTREVFGLEVTHSGFHKMIRDAVADGGSYESVVAEFGEQLGGEARALIRALIATRDDVEGTMN